MLWFILCVAVLNMATGFGLGLYLRGFCYGTVDDTCGDSFGIAQNEHCELELGVEPAAREAAETSAESAPPGEGSLLEKNDTPFAKSDDPRESSSADASGDSTDAIATESPENSVMAELDAAVAFALGDEIPTGDGDENREAISDGKVAESVPENATENAAQNAEVNRGENLAPNEEQLAESRVDDTFQAFQTQLESFCDELIALDEHLRHGESVGTAELKTRLDSVVESSRKQDVVCRETKESLRSMISAATVGKKEGEAMVAAIQEERREAAQATQTFQQIDLEADAATQCDMVLERTTDWLAMNHDIRDSVSDMMSAAHESETDTAGGAKIDPLTEVMSRSTLDALLAEHWRKDPLHARVVTLTVIDIDEFAKFNRSHGPALGNRVLRALGQLFATESSKESYVARFAGQRFALLGIDRDLKQSVSDAERLRQMIETVRFEYGEKDLQLTVSCGIVAAVPKDTQETLYARAVESVSEAKRYGRNRSFVHEGEYPTPVVPPNLLLNEKHVTL